MEATEYKNKGRKAETIFVKPPFVQRGQPSIVVKHGEDTIGWIYKEFDKVYQIEIYHAFDFNGKPIFETENTIDSLETHFKVQSKSLLNEKVYGFRIAPVDHSQRESEIKQMRENKNTLCKQLDR